MFWLIIKWIVGIVIAVWLLYLAFQKETGPDY